MEPLASISDLEARGVVISAEETDLVAGYLDVASALVRNAAGSPVSQTITTLTLEGRGSRLMLPGLPVTAVSAVAVNGVAVSDWKLLSGTLWRPCGFYGVVADVTYTHGLAEVPADIVDIVCRLAGQELVRYRANPDAIAEKPVIQERIGDYSATYGYTVLFSDMELPAYLRARLAARFGNGAGMLRTL